MKSLILFIALYLLLSCGNNNTNATNNSVDTLPKLNKENRVINTDTTLNFEESAEGSLPNDWVAPTGKWTIVTRKIIKY